MEQKHHGKKLGLVEVLRDQYPFAIFYGDVGTGKSAMVEAIGNRIAKDAKIGGTRCSSSRARNRGLATNT